MKDLLVSNTGPIIALAGIGRLDLIRDFFSRCIVPESVHREIVDGGFMGRGVSCYREAGWIEVRAAIQPIDPILKGMLHSGEAEVIAIARELKSETVLIDERRARKVARDIYGLTVVGTVRVLLESKKLGRIANLASVLRQMQDNGYWFSGEVFQFALREAGEDEPTQ